MPSDPLDATTMPKKSEAPTARPLTASCDFPYTTAATVYVLDCSGKRPPNAPEWTVGFGAQQTLPLGNYQFVLNAYTRWQSETLASLEFQDVQYQRPFWRTDASITFEDSHSRYRVTGFVNNIENRRQLGTATLIDVLNVEDRLNNAVQARLQYQLGYAQARAQILYETGSLLQKAPDGSYSIALAQLLP